jgi:RimJ/RimL family protein N-acetyltransferase
MFPDLFCDDVFRLETSRLWLRWPRAADAAQIARLAGERDVAIRTARIPHPFPEGAAAEFILTARAGNACGEAAVLALTRKGRPSELIGCIGLHPDGDGLTLGFWLGKPWWGRGLMTEAVRELVDAAFRFTDAEALNASVFPDNVASRRVLEKAGFSRSGGMDIIAPARGGNLRGDRFVLSRNGWIDRGYVREHRACGAAASAG